MSFCALLRIGLLRRFAIANGPTAKVRIELHLRQRDVHVQLCDIARPAAAFIWHDECGTVTFHDYICRQYGIDVVCHIQRQWDDGLCNGIGMFCITARGAGMVFDYILARVSVTERTIGCMCM